MARRPELVITSGPMSGRRFEVGPGGIRMGRSSTNDVYIPDEGLSRNHCLFEQVGECGIRVTDLASANGTYVNGESLGTESRDLKPGDRIEAGMDFISALQRNCQSRKLDPLNEELLRMTKEIQVGSSRREALRNMADRVRQSDLKSVAFALIQADELGVSIGAILRIQSEQLRSRRFDRAEKLAHEAPTKMLGPLMLCIFPAVFIILLGPVLTQAMKGML